MTAGSGFSSLVPQPVGSSPLPGTLTLSDGLRIETPDELSAVARWFRHILEQATGWDVELAGVADEAVPSGNRIRLVLDPGAPAERGEGPVGRYQLRVADGSATVTANEPAGVFYGLQTLRQLLPDSWWRAAPGAAVPALELAGIDIVDEPAFPWRGVHLDVSRHFMPKGFVLKLIDLIAMHKCNVLHLHLTDDQGWRIPVRGYPRLVEIGAWRRESPAGHYRERRGDGRPHGGYYSSDDLREIVAYAGERFVDVLPEIDMPGHMVAAIAAYPELGNTPEHRQVLTHWGISKHVLNLEPATLQFCTDVLDEVVDIFPFRYVHVGGDECPTAEWESSEGAQALLRQEGLSNERQLQAWFTARMGRHLADRGRTLVGWDEILEGGAPAGAVIMSWQGEEGGISAATAGHDVVMAPQQWLYLDWAYADDRREPLAICPATSVERVWSYDPVPDAIPADRRHHVLGAQCQLWTEYVPDAEHAEYLYFPRLSAFSEVVWRGAAARSGAGGRSFAEFEDRLRQHLRRLDAIGVNYRPLEGPTPGQARVWQE
ncbi:MAG: beta-N-acetylhexosaminidase [Acidimicrobiales bacterium]